MTDTTAPIQRPEAQPMLLVDCPLCDTPAAFESDADALECDACGVRLELDAATPARELALAA